MFCRDSGPSWHRADFPNSLKTALGVTWNSVVGTRKRRAPEQLLNPLNLENGLWIWECGEDNTGNTHTWIQPGEAQNVPLEYSGMLGTQKTAIPLFFLSGSWSQTEPVFLQHCPAGLGHFAQTFPPAPSRALQPILTRGMSPKSPHFAHKFLCQIWEPRAIFFPCPLGLCWGEVSPAWALTLHASLSPCLGTWKNFSRFHFQIPPLLLGSACKQSWQESDSPQPKKLRNLYCHWL